MKNINLKKGIITLATICFVTVSSFAQEAEEEIKPFSKHEIGFSAGAFPVIGFKSPEAEGFVPNAKHYGHYYYKEREGGFYQEMYQYGSYTFNYNYHIDLKKSVGLSLSWIGKHFDKYWAYTLFDTFGHPYGDTIKGSGWQHFFTLQGNYRKTYYQKNKISLYWAINFGITLCVRDKDILSKKTYNTYEGSESSVRYYYITGTQICAFGIGIGKKQIFNIELGVGTQGLFKTGFRYKF